MEISENDRNISSMNNWKRNHYPEILNDLTQICEKAPPLKVSTLNIFGSFMSGLSLPSSDIDIMIRLVNDGEDKAFNLTLNKLTNDDKFRIINSVKRTVVPVISVQHIQRNIICDITFASPTLKREDVFKNTELLRMYSENCVTFKKLFLFIKTVFGDFELFSAKSHGLSSYAHSIILIYYLINRENCVFIDPQTLSLTRRQAYTAPLADILYSYIMFLRDELEDSIIDIYKLNVFIDFDRDGLIIIDPYLRKKDLARNFSSRNLNILKSLVSELMEYIINPDSVIRIEKIKNHLAFCYSKIKSNNF